MLDKVKIGKRIREIRLSMRKTQKEFSKVLDITIGYLSEIETGRKTPGIDMVFSLLDRYNIDVNYLFYGEGGFYRKSDEEKAKLAGEIYSDDWDDIQKLHWCIKKIPLIRYSMLEKFILLMHEKKDVINAEIKKHREATP